MLHSPLADSETDVVSCEKMVQADDPVTNCTPPGGIQQTLKNVMIQRTGEQLLFISDTPCPPTLHSLLLLMALCASDPLVSLCRL